MRVGRSSKESEGKECEGLEDEVSGESEGSDEHGCDTASEHCGTKEDIKSIADGEGSPSAGGCGESQGKLTTAGKQPEPVPAAEAVSSEHSQGFQGNPLLIQSMSKLLQAQTEMLTAQAQAVAVQGLPPIAKFSGENLDSDHDEDGFDKWLEAFEERAHLAGWSQEHKLYQLKIHLEHTALQVFRMLPGESKKVYDDVVSHLQKRFKPVDIEELKGIEFHLKIQGSESIEKLGISLQKLGRKAFPSINGKEYDRLLKGRFFQALHTKWQRKLGAPKPNETFSELYDRARTLERHDKQFTESAAGREKKPVSIGEKSAKSFSGSNTHGKGQSQQTSHSSDHSASKLRECYK